MEKLTTRLVIISLLATVVISACTATGGLTTLTPPITHTPQSSQSIPDATISPILGTTVVPTETSLPTPLNIFLVAIDDGGELGKLIGCNDSLVPFEVGSSSDPDVLRSALEQLLNLKDQQIGNLYNSLNQSDLQIKSISADQHGKYVVELEGETLLGGVCDDPRFQAQIEETILQFPQVRSLLVLINGVPIEEFVSEK